MTEPCFDVAHLGHVEVYTDKFDESLDFFTRVYGLKLSALSGDSAYLRAWDDYEFHSLKLTRHHTTGVGHIAYRVSSPEALERRVKEIEASGYKVHGWNKGDSGSKTRSAIFSNYTGIRCAISRKATTCRRSRTWPAGFMPKAHVPGGWITSTCWRAM
jgi:catechol 2,3-dioxygenase-like lactoylglutathione lyase family enzyme